MKNEKIFAELEQAARRACYRFPRDWQRAGRPAAADLIGAAWIELQADPTITAFEAAKRALFAEAWSMSGHSVGGSVEELTGLESWDGDAADDLAEAAAAILEGANARRPVEDEIITRAALDALAIDETDRAIMRAAAAGLTQEETAAALHISRATVNRRIKAIDARRRADR